MAAAPLGFTLTGLLPRDLVLDSLAKEGAKQHTFPRGLVQAAARRLEIAQRIQQMMVRILQARDPLLQEHIWNQEQIQIQCDRRQRRAFS